MKWWEYLTLPLSIIFVAIYVPVVLLGLAVYFIVTCVSVVILLLVAFGLALLTQLLL